MKILKKINRKSILILFTLCILIILPLLKQGSFYLVTLKVINNYDSINSAYVLYFSIPFLIYVYISNLIKTKRKIDKYDYLFYILVFSTLVISLFSIDKNIAFFGKAYRHEGFFTILCYYLLFINWKIEGNKSDLKKFIKLLIILAVFNSVYALMQLYTPYKFILRYGPNKQMASGISGNPNFFGSFIVTTLSIVTTKFLIEKKLSFKQILLVILFFISLINCQSSGPFIAYIVTLLFFLIYLFIKKKIVLKKIFYLLVILVITYSGIFYINKEIVGINKCDLCELKVHVDKLAVEQNSKDYIYTKITNGRFDIWKKSLNIVKDNLISGVGYDNFYLAYYEDINLTEVTFVSMDGSIKAVKKYSEIVDNAHNTYLHILVSSGLIGLIPYLTLCLITFIKGLKSKNDLIIILFGGFVAYSIQAFANINVIQVAPIYYVIIGLILSHNE